MTFTSPAPPPSASPFPFGELLLPALMIFFVGLIVAWRVTRLPHWSVLVAFIKAGLFMAYYGLLYDGTWNFLDDYTYAYRGEILLNKGVTLLNMFANLPELFSQAGGKHFMYYLYNADAFRLFGTAYYSPVALNIVLTFLAAAFMATAARRGLGFSRGLATGLFIFMALHPDIIAWSTIMNAKDILVLTGTTLAMVAVSLADSGRYKESVALAVAVGTVLFFTRFYIPLMLLLALLGALLMSPLGRRRPGLWLLGSAGVGSIVFGAMGVEGLANNLERLQEDFVNPLYGVPRMTLTPIPFNTTEKNTFLDLPQVFHWIMLPALAYGVARIWHRATLTSRFMVIFFLLMILLYGVFGELQGPRHRLQLDGLIALFQFYGGVGILAQIVGNRPRRVARPFSIPPSSVVDP